MNGRSKVAVSLLAAHEKGFLEKLAYPIVQTYIYYLGTRGVKLPGYVFSSYEYPENGGGLMTYLWSSELADDLNSLWARGILRIDRGSTLYSLGEISTSDAAQLKQEFQNEKEMTYEALCELAKTALENPRQMLEMCYRAYIEALCTKPLLVGAV